jgi:hypothetical protein
MDLEQVWNATDESVRHSEKQDSHKISTDDGITIDCIPILENADFSMR